MTAPSIEPSQAAHKVSDFLSTLLARGRFELTATVLPPDHPDNFENSEPSDAPHLPAPLLRVEFAGPDTPILLARNAELLLALEHITAKFLGLDSDEHDLLSFDADRFKVNRDRELIRSAQSAIEQVHATGRPFSFPPMTSRERRLLHLALHPSGLPTASSGEPPRRFVVLYPDATQPRPAASLTPDRTAAVRQRFRRR